MRSGGSTASGWTPFGRPEPRRPSGELTQGVIEAYLAARARWIAEENLLQEAANELAQSIGFQIRQRYDLPPTDPRYLAMDDIDLRLEFKALDAHRRWLKGQPLPGQQSSTHATTENFDDIVWAIENDLWDWDDDETLPPPDDWEEIDPHEVAPPSLRPE